MALGAACMREREKVNQQTQRKLLKFVKRIVFDCQGGKET
jgi:hypothetical protein